MEGSKCWDTGIGSEAFITYLTEQHLVNHTLTVTTQKCTEEGCCVSISAQGLSIS